MPEEEQLICRTCKNVAVNGTIDGECDSCHVQRVLQIRDDERMPATPPEQHALQGQVAINLGAAGMTVTINQQPINLTIDEEGMNQMVTQWLASHPALMDELIKKRVAQKQTELAIIRDIRSAKLH